MLYVAATPDRQLAQLEAHLAQLDAELNELKPEHKKLCAEQREARQAKQVAEKAADAARAHLKELQSQGADEDSIKAANEAVAEATTLLNRRQAEHGEIAKTTEHVGSSISSIRESISTILKTIHVIEANISAKEAAAAKGALLVLLLCLAAALPHGS